MSGDRVYLTANPPHGEEQDSPVRHRSGSHDNTLKVYESLFVVIAIVRKDGKNI